MEKEKEMPQDNAFDLEDIMKEFSQPLPEEALEAGAEEAVPAESTPEDIDLDTILAENAPENIDLDTILAENAPEDAATDGEDALQKDAAPLYVIAPQDIPEDTPDDTQGAAQSLEGDTVAIDPEELNQALGDTVAVDPEELTQALEGDTVRIDTQEISQALEGDTVAIDPEELSKALEGDTVAIDPEELSKALEGDTVAIDPEELTRAMQEQKAQQEQAEPFSSQWEPQYEEPMGEYVPPQPILFHPRSKLKELKQKLVAGPEKHYYELTEQGFGKLQAAVFFSFLLVLLSAGATALYALGMVQPERMKLMIFSQFFFLLLSALLGSYQLMAGFTDLFRGRFTLNTLLLITFAACCTDGVFCLGDATRVPCCAAFGLQVTMSLWNEYHNRVIEIGQMDSLRKATRLDGLKSKQDLYEGCKGILRAEGQVEDFMDNYRHPTGIDKAQSIYSVIVLCVSIGSAVLGGILHKSIPFGVQVLSISLLAGVPASLFVVLSRPMAILEKRLHKHGAVLCGWQGVLGLTGRVTFPVDHEDLFPTGSCKLNGVKYYGSRNPDQVVAYAAAVVCGRGGSLVPIFEHLLESRNGRHYNVKNLRSYEAGGAGGEVCGEPVLIGTLPFLREMGVEIPEGTSVNQAVYVAVDGELCGVFAVTYSRNKSSAQGIQTLTSYRGLQALVTSRDFMLTEGFLRSRFGINTRRMAFPEESIRTELAQAEPDEDKPSLALTTGGGLAPMAYAITGARAVRSASRAGLVIHLLGGALGLAMMAILAFLGQHALLTPANMLLYQLLWLIPGLLVTEWTRSV